MNTKLFLALALTITLVDIVRGCGPDDPRGRSGKMATIIKSISWHYTRMDACYAFFSVL